MKTSTAHKIIAMLLTMVMLISIVPVTSTPASAADAITSTTTNSNTDDGVSMKKTSTYDPDTGKMDITIEAYTTGHVVSSSRTVPTDIILVLDVSGSMNSTRMTSMKNAVNNFIATTKTQNDSVVNDADKHSIAIVKFAENSFYSASNPLAVGNHRNGSNYNYTEVIADFTTVNASGVTSLQTAVNALNSGGATAVDYGLNLATQLFNARDTADSGAYSGRNKVIIVFADGEPNHQSGYDSEVAYNAVGYALELKSDNIKIFTIGIFDGADHTDTTSDANKFMNYLSSNYPLAYGSTTIETGSFFGYTYEYTAYHINPGAEPHYNTYYHDADTDSLNSVFQTIASSVGSPQIELGSSATLVDVVSDYFDISYVGENPDISVYTSNYKGGADFTAAANWDTPVAATGVTAAVSGDGDTVTVSGFDYDTNYISSTARDGGFYGKKLILKISTTPDYAAIDAATDAGTLTSALIPTNNTSALLDSSSVNAAWVSNPALQANTVTYKVVVDGAETVTDTYYRFPGGEKDLIDKPTDTDEHSYSDWDTDDTTINGGSITMPSGDVEFISEATVKKYGITFEYTGNLPDGAPTVPTAMVDIPVGTPVTLPTVTAPAGYAFSGWTEDGGDAPGTAFNMPSQDLHFRGHFIAQPSGYTVEHYLMNTDGTWPTTPDETIPLSATTGSTVTAQLTHHTGFTYDEDYTRNHQLTDVTVPTTSDNDMPQAVVKADGSTVLKLYYKRNVYKVSYEYEGTVPTGATPTYTETNGNKVVDGYTHTYRYGEEVTIAADAVAIGYTFSGWTINTGATSINGGKMIMPDSDVVLRGSFTASDGIKYTVKHYFETADSTDLTIETNYAVDETKTKILYGTTGDKVTAVPLSDLIGFKYEPDMSSASGTIAGNGSLVLELYYSRTRHTVEYQYRSTVPANASPSISELSTYTATYKYGDTVTVKQNATATGYNFSGWSTTDATVSGNTFTMPASDVDFYGQFSPAANKYVVELYFMDTNGSYPSTTDHKHTYDDVHTGDAVTATISEQTGFTHDSEYAGNVLSGTVAADGSTVLKVYYKRNQFTVTYQYDNAPDGVGAPPVDNTKYYFGQTVTLKDKPVVEGYTFHGWSIYTGQTSITGNTMTMPNSNVILHGSFTANSDTKYTVEHYFEKVTSDNPSNKDNYERDVNLTAVLSGTTGDTVTAEPYSGTVGVKYEPTLSKASGEITGDGNLVLKLYYSRSRHKVTYQYLNTVPGASALPSEATNIKYGEIVTLAGAASAPGYTFSGWSTTDIAVSGNQFTMPARDVVISGSFAPLDNTYTVEIYEQNTDGTWPGTTAHKHVYDGVKTGDTVTATLPTIAGLTYSESETAKAGNQNAGVSIVEVGGKNVPQAAVAPEGATVLKLYYARNAHKVSYQYVGYVPDDATPLPDNTAYVYYVGQEVELIGSATANGYTFSGWTVNSGDIAIDNNKIVMPDSDVVFYGSFTASGDTPYKVEHYFETLSGTYVIDDSKTQDLTGVTGDTVTAMPLSGPEVLGFTYDEDKTRTEQPSLVPTTDGADYPKSPIAADGSLILKLYYNRTRHTVTYQYTGSVPGDATELPAKAIDVMYGTPLQRAANATAQGYAFSGWTVTPSISIDGNGNFTMPAADITFTGHFIPQRNTYRVEHYLMGTDGEYPSSASHFYDITDAVTGQHVSAETNVLHTGFTFDAATTGDQYKGTVAANGSTVLKLYFKRNQHTVTYQYDGTVPAGASPGTADLASYTATYYYQQIVTIKPYATAPGYTFTGWAIHTGDTAIDDGKMVMPNSDVIIHGAFNASHNTLYTVQHFFENVDSTNHNSTANYTLDTTKTQYFSGTTNADVVAEPLSGPNILGFDYYPNLSISTGKIAADGKLVLNLYYKRMDTVIKYQFTGSVPAGAVTPATAHSTFGATAVVADTPAIEGYTFHGWYNELGITYGSDNKFTVPAVSEIIFSGRFTANPNKYTVEHYMMGTDGNYPATASHSYEVTNVVTGQSVEASTAVTHTGFTFDSTTTGNQYKGTVAANGSTVLKLYFKRNQYTVTYQYDGIVPAGASPAYTEDSNHNKVITTYTSTHFFEEVIDIKPDASAPSYIFTGWGIHTGDTTISGGKMKMPSSNVIIHGAFNPDPNTKYIVEHYFELHDNTPNSIDFAGTPDKTTIGTGKTGSTVTAMPLSGSEVLGFTYDEDKTRDNQHPTNGGTVPDTTGADYPKGIITADSNSDGYGDLVLKLYYKRLANQVIYEYTGTVPYGAPDEPDETTHKYGEEVTVANNPSFAGYTFSGWEPWDTTVVSVNNGKFIMPERTVYFHGSFSADPSHYTVNHFLMNADGTYPNTPTTSERFSVGIHVDDAVKAVPATTYRTYHYDEDTTTSPGAQAAGVIFVIANGVQVPQGTVDENGTLVLNLYYSRNTYTLTYKFSGEVPTGAAVPNPRDNIMHGAVVDLDDPTGIPSGYRFDGWYYNNSLVGDSLTMPAADTVVTGQITARTDVKYTVEYYLEKLDGTYELNHFDEFLGTTGAYVAGARIDFTGFTFNMEKSTWNGHIKGDGSLVLKLYYDRNLYTVIYTDGVDDEDVFTDQVYTSIKYNANTPAFNGTPNRAGFDFDGWHPAVNATVTANATYVAQWSKQSGGGGGGGGGGTTSTTGTAKLLKVDAADSSTVLADVVFQLHKKDGTLVGTYTTDAQGIIKVSDLAAGDYYWQEVLPAEGYTVDSTHRDFTVSAGKTAYLTVTNSRTPIPEVFTGDHYGYIIGYEDGMVHPERNISRAEVATIFFRLLDDNVRDERITRENTFPDVNEGDWFNVAVSTMYSLGIIGGYEDGTFRPNAPITRAEFAAIASRFDMDGDASDTIFKDIYEHWGRREINIAANNGWVLGYEDGTFKPDSLVTRAEAMTMVNRVLQRIPQSSSDLLSGMIQWPDNQDTHKWYYLVIQEATNSHHYDRKDNGYEKWTALREPRDWDALQK